MTDDQIEFHLSEEHITRWIIMPILSADDPVGKLYTCYGQYHSSGFWKRFWLRLKIWYYRRLIRNDR